MSVALCMIHVFLFFLNQNISVPLCQNIGVNISHSCDSIDEIVWGPLAFPLSLNLRHVTTYFAGGKRVRLSLLHVFHVVCLGVLIF